MFLERQKVLEAMANQLKPTNGLVKTLCRVTSLHETRDGVTIITDDGLSATADLVIGADGVRSCVRTLIDNSLANKEAESDNCVC